METTELTIENFELYLIDYGADIDAWPAALRPAAGRIASSEAGRKVLQDHLALTGLFAASQRQLGNNSTDGSFIDTLLGIPDTSMQKKAVTEGGDRLSAWFERIFSLSPVGLASQMASVAALLLVGVFVGLQSPPSGAIQDPFAESIDLSDSYYAALGPDGAEPPFDLLDEEDS